MNKLTSNRITAVLCAAVICTISLLTVLGDKAKRSHKENRELAQAPDITLSGLYDGSTSQQFGKYATDQFAGRSKWLVAKTAMQTDLSESIVNGVYVSDKRLLGTDFCSSNSEKISSNADLFSQYALKYDGMVYFAAIPSSTGIYGDILPPHIVRNPESQSITEFYNVLSPKIRKIDAYNILKNLKDNYIYYRNDTKWTCYGAYCVYKTVIQKLGFLPTTYDKYNIEHVSDKFRGDLYNKTLSESPKCDIIDIYTPQDGAKIVSCSCVRKDGIISDSEVFDKELLDSDNMYSMYLGEPVPVINIKTSAQNDKKILVIKDEYADCFIPFLTQHYSEITVISPKEISGKLSDVVNINDYGQTLFLFGVCSLGDREVLEKIIDNPIR
jgi:hypothetical protein